MKKGAQRGDA